MIQLSCDARDRQLRGGYEQSVGDENKLAEFLRLRRATVRPEDVGIADLGRRRVPGLRREELAMLAGVSIDYYTRLEQGRDRHPSPQVLQALALPLRLDEAAVDYLRRLAEPTPRRRPRRRAEKVGPGTLRILETFDANPAYVTGRYRDILASNPLAVALNPGFADGSNMLRYVFLEPSAREAYAEWDAVAAETVATLRAAMGTYVDEDDPTLTDLVGELSLKSEDFRRFWARQEVRAKQPGSKRFTNPLVGPIALEYEAFTVTGLEGQTLIVYHAEPGTPDAQALTLLAAIVAG